MTLAVCAQGTREETVAAVANMEVTNARDALNHLADISLVSYIEQAIAPWALHDVVRMFALAQPGRRELEEAHLIWVESYMKQHEDPQAFRELEICVPEGLTLVNRLIRNAQIKKASTVFYPLYLHLTRRGEYAVVVDMAKELLLSHAPKGSAIEAAWLGNLGLCYETLGDIPKAIDFHEQALALEKKLGLVEGRLLVSQPGTVLPDARRYSQGH